MELWEINYYCQQAAQFPGSWHSKQHELDTDKQESERSQANLEKQFVKQSLCLWAELSQQAQPQGVCRDTLVQSAELALPRQGPVSLTLKANKHSLLSVGDSVVSHTLNLLSPDYTGAAVLCKECIYIPPAVACASESRSPLWTIPAGTPFVLLLWAVRTDAEGVVQPFRECRSLALAAQHTLSLLESIRRGAAQTSNELFLDTPGLYADAQRTAKAPLFGGGEVPVVFMFPWSCLNP